MRNKIIRSIILASLATLLVVYPALAAYLYYAQYTISNSTATAYDMLAVNKDASNEWMAANGFMKATALDTRIETLGGTELPWMVSTDRTTTASPVPATSDVNLYYTMGNDTDATSMDVITGYDGLITIPDSVPLEPGNLFWNEHETAWIDTSYSLDKYFYDKQGATDTRVTATSAITAGIYNLDVVDVSPTTYTAWTDVDVSGYIASDATGVVLEIIGSGVASGVRKNGSTDNRIGVMEHNWVMIGVDANGVFEAYLADVTVIINLVGYTDSRWIFKTNADDVSLGVALAWTDADVSTEAPNATGVIIEIVTTVAGADNVGVRNNGSGDARTDLILGSAHYFTVIGVDAAQIFEGYVGLLTTDFYLVGYVTDGATFNVNATDYSLAGAAAWTGIDASAEAPNAEFLIFEVIGGPGDNYGFRKNGSSDTTVQTLNNRRGWAVVPCDEAQIVEGYIDFVAVDFFLVGWIDSGGYLYYTETSASEEQGLKVVATGITNAEVDIGYGIKDDPGVASYDASVNIGVSMGGGMLPVRVLEKQTLTAPAASVNFAGIDTLVADWDAKAGVTSRHLVMMVNAASPDAVAQRDVQLQFNGDVGANYYYQYLEGENAVDSTLRVLSQTSSAIFPIPGTTYANAFGGGTILIPHAFNTANHKTYITFGGAVEDEVETTLGRWADISAIDSVDIFASAGNIATGSTFILGVIDERYLVEEKNLSIASLISFTAIPQDGYDLVTIGYLRASRVATVSILDMSFNGDAVNANYPRELLFGNGGVVTAQSAADLMIINTNASTSQANTFSAFVQTISQYADATNQPQWHLFGGYIFDGTTAFNYANNGRWSNVNAINRIDYNSGHAPGTWEPGSLFSLYRVPRYVIDRQELTAPAATITFDNIPQGYEAVQLNVYTRSDLAAINENVEITLNADAVAANYDFQELTGTGAVVAAARNAASQVLMAIPAANEGANEFGGGVVTLNQYSTTVGHKHFTTLSGTNENQVIIRSSRWEDASAITRIDLDLAGANNFIAGSVFELVGVMPTKSFMIEVDGDVEAIEAAGSATVPDNASDIVVAQNNTIAYAESHKFNKDNVMLFTIPAVTSNINFGAIYDNVPDWWMSMRFMFPEGYDAPGGGNPDNAILLAKRDGAGNIFMLYLNNASNSITFWNSLAGYSIGLAAPDVSWLPGKWYHVLVSNHSVNGARLRVDNGVAATSVLTSNLPNGGTMYVGNYAWWTAYRAPTVANVVMGTDALTLAEETVLFNGVLPDDETDFWPVNEGNGNAIVSYGSAANPGTAGANTKWDIIDREQELGQYEAWYQPITMVIGTSYDGTADALGDTTHIVDAELTQASDYWNNALVTIVTTTDTFAPQGETSVVTDFDTATDTLTISPALTVSTDAGDTYTVDFGTLQDRTAKDNDARITWGVNPSGITTTLGVLTSAVIPSSGIPEELAPDVLPTISPSTSGTSWFSDPDAAALALNPFHPIIEALAEWSETSVGAGDGFTETQVWRLFGFMFVMLITGGAAAIAKGHMFIASVACSGAIVILVFQTIFPMAVLVVLIPILFAGLLLERSPSV